MDALGMFRGSGADGRDDGDFKQDTLNAAAYASHVAEAAQMADRCGWK